MRTTADGVADGRVRNCAVLGSPIAHSLSPVIHQAAYRYLELEWTYTAYEVDEPDLAGFVAGLDHSWRGLSLTMPLKRVALDVADDASGLARTVGAANTLIRADDGRLFADNTDVPGFMGALGERGIGTPDAKPGTVCVWGGGATAASVLAALATLDAGTTHLHARSAQRAKEALELAEALGRPAGYVPWEVADVCATSELTVNTAPAGALDPFAEALTTNVNGERALFDVLYEPWPTPLAARWAQAGGIVLGGLDLLVHQALGQVRLMTGHDVPVDVLRDAAQRALSLRTRT
ncbi:shikimate dehydrogenase [Phytoactinopolyspora mesophila]|uniref:shikimate dehydrogenase n=1 Tax=Phytoactinopolyspora mesophila TaxID=2650750 RepID=UPI001C9E65E2